MVIEPATFGEALQAWSVVGRGEFRMIAFSEAIRLGALLKPQGQFRLLRGGRSCALGAALDAIGQLGDVELVTCVCDPRTDICWSTWPVLQQYVVNPFFPHKPLAMVIDIVIAANDRLDGWTREQIADWVESIERAHEPSNPVQALSLLAVGSE